MSNLDEINPETIPSDDLMKAVADVSSDIHEIVETQADDIAGEETQADDVGLPLRDLLGLDKAMQTVLGNL